MTASFIVDCSVAMTWLFEDEATVHTINLFHRLDAEAALVPALWHLEVTNALTVAERRGRVSRAKSDIFVSALLQLEIEVDHESSSRAYAHLLPLCRKHQLSSYDATYLDLAIRRKLPLATLDEPLRKAAKKLGVKLLGK
ncbi:MAG: type II toxin-antitoxin system VapC family toxin [Pirellulales bacterium]